VKILTDTKIIDLYESRSESAISETAARYGAYCTRIAMNILDNAQDAEECVNDAYLKAWNLIPPERPSVFSAFLGRITRNLSLDRYKSRKASKRQGDETALLLSELDGCVPNGSTVEEDCDARALEAAINAFLDTVDKESRVFFVRRYWYNDSIADIARRYDAGESKVKTNLCRTRKKLRESLKKEGIMT
jgi:RNA polymerase sigma-70 factor (ECF subfamily)